MNINKSFLLQPHRPLPVMFGQNIHYCLKNTTEHTHSFYKDLLKNSRSLFKMFNTYSNVPMTSNNLLKIYTTLGYIVSHCFASSPNYAKMKHMSQVQED